MTPFDVRLTFHGDLPFFLGSKRDTVDRRLKERTSVKDIIEACRVPHTEVDLILVNDQPVSFSYVVGSEATIEVIPIDLKAFTSFRGNRLQVRGIRKFVADGHLGKLVRDLRLLGIDILYDRDAEDRQLVEVATDQERALLTRDRPLLMHAALRHGYYLRSQNPLRQAIEVLRRFDLVTALAPFSRCLRCNAPLESAEKEKIISQLEPLTKIYYHQFRRCSGCDQVYWPGSHFEKLQKRIEAIRGGLEEP
ncbi:MAG TPA: Mut7-C RNAse domain-containing protein [Chthoniobacterales bacterium]|nr:Mut7-C RNAse domain-containing protein [Chthoniobacterales bacterium]